MNRRDRLPVALGVGLLVAMLGAFQAVVKESVDIGSARRGALAQSQQRAWRCSATRAHQAQPECLLPQEVATSGSP